LLIILFSASKDVYDKQRRSYAYARISHVERRPSHIIYSEIEKVNHRAPEYPVDKISGSAGDNHTEGVLLKRAELISAPIQPYGDEQQKNRHKYDKGGIVALKRAECRARVSDMCQIKKVKDRHYVDAAAVTYKRSRKKLCNLVKRKQKQCKQKRLFH